MPTEKEKGLTMDDLKALIAEGNKAAITEAMKELRGEMQKSAMRAIFPTAEDGTFENELKTMLGTEVNPYVLSKFTELNQKGHFLGENGDKDAGNFCVTHGLFKRLSPAMYKFGELLKNFKAFRTGMYPLGPYQEFVDKCDKAMGYKAATDLGSAAGIPIPVEYPAMMIEMIWGGSPLLSKVWRVPMNTQTTKFPKLFQGEGSYFGGMVITAMGKPDASATGKGEGTALTHTKPTIEWLTFEAKKIAAVTALTEELMSDSVINILNYVTGLYIRAMQYAYEGYIISGDGVYEPLGITVDPSVINKAVVRATAGTVKRSDFIDLEGNIDEICRDENLMWLTRRLTMSKIRREEDTVGQPKTKDTWAQMQSDGSFRPAGYMGHPVHYTRNVPALGQRGDVILCDPSFYMFAVRNDMRIDTSDAPYFLQDQTALRIVSRIDGKPGTELAFRMLKASVS